MLILDCVPLLKWGMCVDADAQRSSGGCEEAGMKKMREDKWRTENDCPGRGQKRDHYGHCVAGGALPFSLFHHTWVWLCSLFNHASSGVLVVRRVRDCLRAAVVTRGSRTAALILVEGLLLSLYLCFLAVSAFYLFSQVLLWSVTPFISTASGSSPSSVVRACPLHRMRLDGQRTPRQASTIHLVRDRKWSLKGTIKRPAGTCQNKTLFSCGRFTVSFVATPEFKNSDCLCWGEFIILSCSVLVFVLIALSFPSATKHLIFLFLERNGCGPHASLVISPHSTIQLTHNGICVL